MCIHLPAPGHLHVYLYTYFPAPGCMVMLLKISSNISTKLQM